MLHFTIYEHKIYINPFTDLSVFGFDLQKCTIRHYRPTGDKCAAITGVFIISGREFRAGADNYEQLIMKIVELKRAHLREVRKNKYNKRKRNWLSWFTRNPEYAVS
jgi:hypothetical protein